MEPDNRQTMHISQDDIQAALEQQHSDPHLTDMLSDINIVVFHIDGYKEHVRLSDGDKIILGRFQFPEQHHLDLTPYDALQHGISREHAEVHIRDNRIYLIDLGSTNGSYIHGERLKPSEPHLLQNGDDILLGRMNLKIFF